MEKSDMSIEDFRNVLEDKTEILNTWCTRWAQILEQETQTESALNDETLGAIRTAIGQAKLLMSQRFKQFSDLIDSCQHQTGQHPTRLSDLSGFWDMISIQVEDVTAKFKTLESVCQQLLIQFNV